MATSTHGSRSSTFKFNETTTAPTVSDDGTAGYSVGSMWYDTTAQKAYVCLSTATGAAVWTEITASGSGYRTLVTLGSDVASAADTNMQDITGLSFPVVNGVTRRWQALLLYTCSSTTIGIRVSVNGPASLTHLAYRTEVYQSTTTLATANTQIAYNAGNASLQSVDTNQNLLVMDGIIRTAQDGTLQLRFAPETATANGIIIKAGSTVEWW